MLIVMVSGARPQFIKLAPLINACKNIGIDVYHIHSGQHYDKNMSDNIFTDLNMDPPNRNLNVGSGAHGIQTGRMIQLIESEIIKIQPNLMLVVGDTNSTLAGAIAASKLSIPIIHLEAGLRSFDWKMPEEINRILVDRISSLVITSTKPAVTHLKEEGIKSENIFVTGDIMVDSIYNHIDKINENSNSRKYILVTLHRQENVDIKEKLEKIIRLFKLSPVDIIFPMHPRTKKRFEEFKLFDELINIKQLSILQPQGYLDFLKLQYNSIGMITDSGGLQKEAFILKKPCITMRSTTEWVETLEMEANRLLDFDIENIVKSINEILTGEFKVENNHPYGDGKTSVHIANEIKNRFDKNLIKFEDNINRSK